MKNFFIYNIYFILNLAYKLPAEHLNCVEFCMTNPLPIKLHIGYIDLIIESQDSKKFSIETFRLEKNESNQEYKRIREFVLPAAIQNHTLKMFFELKSLGTFKIIGK